MTVAAHETASDIRTGKAFCLTLSVPKTRLKTRFRIKFSVLVPYFVLLFQVTRQQLKKSR